MADQDNRVLTERELAEALDLSYWTVRNLRLREGLPCVKAGSRYLYRMGTVQAWFDARESSGGGAANQETITGTLRVVK